MMVSCPICENAKDEKNFIETFISSFNDQEYKLYHCNVCDLLWWEPLKILPEFYDQEADSSYIQFHLGLREEMSNNHKMFFKCIPIKSGRLLDVGCGDGLFLKEARKAGYEVWGIDFDSKSIKVCQEKWDLKNTFAMSLSEFLNFCKKEGLSFDIITFFEVLEHQDRPRDFLEMIKQMLKPGGYIAGTVSNRDTWQTKLWRGAFPLTDRPPNHFFRFSDNCLKYLYESMVFKDIFLKPFSCHISGITAILLANITGFTIYEHLMRKILTHKHASVGTNLYKKFPLWRKGIFKTLKGISITLFLPISLLISFTTSGLYLYFQSKRD